MLPDGHSQGAPSAERLLHGVPQPACADHPATTVGIGAARFSEDRTPDGVLRLAGQRLYRAKAQGRNCAVMD